jgi:hypothetical protein
MITIGSLSLDDSYSPVVNSSYEYYKTTGGETIGGFQLIKITGSVIVGDQDNTATGAIVMGKLKGIINLGKQTKCINVTIPSFYTGKAKINGVTVDQGSDPTWINKGDYSIEIKAPLNQIPANSFNLVAKDCVTEISRSSKVELPEDSHGYIYAGGLYSKVFAVSTTSLTVKCEPLCDANNFFGVVNKLIKEDLHPALGEFSSWNKFARSLSVQVGPENTATINKDYIITPHPASAFVDLNFGHERSYENKSKKKVVGGTITGLTNAGSFGTTTISDTCSASRLSNAESAFASISSIYSNISSWEGIELDLIEISNCPDPNAGQGESCYEKDADEEDPCLKPRTSSVSRSRTEGTINFSFEWNTDDSGDCGAENGVTTDINVDIREPEPQYIEFVIPLRGTLIQNLNAVNARTINITITKSFPDNSCGAVDTCENDPQEISNIINDILNGNGGVGAFLLINDKKITSTNSLVIEKGFIQCDQ